MNNDAAVIKILADIGALPEPQLTPEQEEMLKRALDPDCSFYDDIMDVFDKNSS